MKLPDKREAYLVWPPLGLGLAAYIVITASLVFPEYHSLLAHQGGTSLLSGYAFPPLMGLALGSRLQGRYWLGFAWCAFACYFACSLVLLLDTETAAVAAVFKTLVALFLMFASQSTLLRCKRH